MMNALFWALMVLLPCDVISFGPFPNHVMVRSSTAFATRLSRSSTLIKRYAGDIQPIEEMKAGEIKAELDLRGVSWASCYDKTDLVDLLERSRLEGKSDPKLVDDMSKEMAENMMRKTEGAGDPVDFEGFDYGSATAGDGKLPGGLSPDAFKKMVKDPAVMTMLANPKVQDIMKDVMAGGPEAMQKYMNDPESLEVIEKLTKALSDVS